MKSTAFSIFTSVLIAVTLVSCVSMQDREMTATEWAQVQVLGEVSAEFHSWQFFHIPAKKKLRQKAYIELMREARKQYEGNIEIRNINIIGGWSGWEVLNILGYAGGGVAGGLSFGIGAILIPFVGNTQKITATGNVILLEQTTESQSRSRVNRANATGIEKAIYTVSDDLIKDLPENSKIAVISISSNNRDVSALVVDELEYHLVSAKKFTIVDRRTLDAIRAEQNFQMSGDVSDASAVSIGQMLGANIVITGSITGAGTNQRLSIRALDVNTAQIVTMVRETF